MKLLKGSLLFLLLWEWLKPLSKLASFNHFSIFVIVMAMFSAAEIVQIHALKRIILKTVIFLGALYELAKGLPKPSQTLWEFFHSDILFNYQRILEYHWSQTTSFGRSLLFILLLWLFVDIAYRSMRNHLIGLLLCTLAYMILLDITTVIDMKGMVIRVCILSLLLLSVEQLKNIELQVSKPVWFGATSLIIALIMVIAYSVPKPKEAGPYLFQNYAIGPSIINKKVGYDSEDHRLGGPFTEDNTVVFHAEVSEKQYWRGESRSVYTGSEWRSEGNEQTTLPLGPQLGLDMSNQAAKNIENKVEVTFTQPKYNTLFYDGTPKEISEISPEPSTLFTTGNQDIKVKYGAGVNVSSYQMTEELPVINEQVLRNSKASGSEALNREYLQLPLTLPDRVRQLGQRITRGQNNAYDKALAIENYLKYQGGYTYEKTNVPIPGPGQDFVDQFLFEAKRGYCDHFSSSMVVLLRSVGIPARYVQGFSSGEVVPASNHRLDITVRNKDAHSWVEVYFNDYGWVRFDPTPGFTNPQKIEAGSKQEEKKAEAPVNVPPVPPLPQNQVDKQKQVDSQTGVHPEVKIAWGKWIAIVLSLVMIGLWVKRRRIHLKILEMRGKRATSTQQIFDVYLSFLSLLGTRFTRRRKDETVQEFVHRLPLEADIKKELKQLTNHYEGYVYGKEISDIHEVRSLLFKLIHHFLS